MEITPEILSFVAGMAISIIMSALTFVPSWQKTWEGFSDKQRQSINAAAVAVVAVVIGVSSCQGWVDWSSCNENGWVSLGLSVAAALGGNVTAFKSTKHIIRKS